MTAVATYVLAAVWGVSFRLQGLRALESSDPDACDGGGLEFSEWGS